MDALRHACHSSLELRKATTETPTPAVTCQSFFPSFFFGKQRPHPRSLVAKLNTTSDNNNNNINSNTRTNRDPYLYHITVQLQQVDYSKDRLDYILRSILYPRTVHDTVYRCTRTRMRLVPYGLCFQDTHYYNGCFATAVRPNAAVCGKTKRKNARKYEKVNVRILYGIKHQRHR